jgi:hypothetical protein
LARSIFSCLDENAHEAGGHGATHVGFRIIANHHNILCCAAEAFDRHFKERRRRLAEHCCLSTGSVFETRDERTGVEAQFTVMIEEVAVLRQGEKLGSVKNLPKGSVQQIVGEERARISDNNGFVTLCRQSRKVLVEVGMRDKEGR